MAELTNARYTNLFASPLMAHVWADAAELNGELVERILEHRQRAQAKPGQMSAAGTLIPASSNFAADRATATSHMYEMADRVWAKCWLNTAGATADAVDITCLGKRQSVARLQPDAHASRCHLVGR